MSKSRDGEKRKLVIFGRETMNKNQILLICFSLLKKKTSVQKPAMKNGSKPPLQIENYQTLITKSTIEDYHTLVNNLNDRTIHTESKF